MSIRYTHLTDMKVISDCKIVTLLPIPIRNNFKSRRLLKKLNKKLCFYVDYSSAEEKMKFFNQERIYYGIAPYVKNK